MEKRFSLLIDEKHAGMTVKQILIKDFELGSGQIKKAKFRENGITVNDRQVTVRYELSQGELLKVLIEEKEQASCQLIPLEGELKVLKEAEDYIAVEKPAGIVCHPSAGHYRDSMANLIVGYFAKRGEGYVVRLLGRLDKGTSGILLYAKNAPALTALERQRDAGMLKKTYYALIQGCPREDSFDVEIPIAESGEVPLRMIRKPLEEGGLRAVSHVEILKRNEILGASLARVRIETGRTHQIRVHMALSDYPLLGDPLYGGPSELQGVVIERPMLHAGELEFEDPTSKERVRIDCDMPEDFARLLKNI